MLLLFMFCWVVGVVAGVVADWVTCASFVLSVAVTVVPLLGRLVFAVAGYNSAAIFFFVKDRVRIS